MNLASRSCARSGLAQANRSRKFQAAYPQAQRIVHPWQMVRGEFIGSHHTEARSVSCHPVHQAL